MGKTKCEQAVQHLQQIALLASSDSVLAKTVRRTNLKVLFEFLDDGQVVPYHFTIADGDAAIQPGELDYQECDLVIRTSPDTLYSILSGKLGTRDVLLGGAVGILKAPDITKLMVLRALFNRYRKSKLNVHTAAVEGASIN
jgi:hypothetical protein